MMTSKEKRIHGLQKLRKMRVWMIIAYSIIVIAALGVVSVFTAQRNEVVMKRKNQLHDFYSECTAQNESGKLSCPYGKRGNFSIFY